MTNRQIHSANCTENYVEEMKMMNEHPEEQSLVSQRLEVAPLLQVMLGPICIAVIVWFLVVSVIAIYDCFFATAVSYSP